MRSTFSFAPEVTATNGGKGLKIGEVSKRTGVGIEALRFYEKSGLLDRPRRTGSGYRVYDESVLDRLAFIKKAQVLGFTLDEIRSVAVDLDDSNLDAVCREVAALYHRKLAELDERIREVERLQRRIRERLVAIGGA